MFLSSIFTPIYTRSWELLCSLRIREGHSSYVCGSRLLHAFGLLQPTGLPHMESVFRSCWNDPLPDLTGITHPQMQTRSTVTALELSMGWALQLPSLFEDWSSTLWCGTPVSDVGRMTLATCLVFIGNSQCEHTHRATSCNPLLGWPVLMAQSGLSYQAGSRYCMQ